MKKLFLILLTILFIIFVLPGMILGFELGYVFFRGSILCGIQGAFMFIPEFIQHPTVNLNLILYAFANIF